MLKIDPQDAQTLLDRLHDVGQQAAASKDEAEANMTGLQSLMSGALKDACADANGTVDAARWSGLPEEEQRLRYDRLVRVVDSTAVLLQQDGPTDPHSIMYRQYVSNFWVIVLTLIAMAGTVTMLFFIQHNFRLALEGQPGGATPGAKPGPSEDVALLMVMMMGALGGLLHLTSSLAKYVGNRNLLRSWIVYYLLMPVEGPALAVALYLLLRVGVLNPSSAGQGSTGNINWVGIYGFSILAGIFSKQALEMLGNVFNTVFGKVQGKDAGGGGKPDNTKPAAKP